MKQYFSLLLSFAAISINVEGQIWLPFPERARPQDAVHSVDISDYDSIFCSQEDTYWCWAACNQMLLKAAKIQVSQTDQAKKRTKLFRGEPSDGAGNDFSQAASCLSGIYTNDDGKTVKVKPYISYVKDHHRNDADVIIDSLKRQQPVVVATIRHGCVCVGVDYITDGINKQITVLRVLDPEHGNIRTTPEMYPVTIGALKDEGGFGFMTIKVETVNKREGATAQSKNLRQENQKSDGPRDNAFKNNLLKIVSAAKNNFKSIAARNNVGRTDSEYYSKISLPSSLRSEVDTEIPYASFWFSELDSTDDADAAESAFNKLVGKVKDSLGENWSCEDSTLVSYKEMKIFIKRNVEPDTDTQVEVLLHDRNELTLVVYGYN